MRAFFFILLLLAAPFIVPSITSEKDNKLWCCWAVDVSDPSNGTYSINSNRAVAERAAIDLCQKMFGKCRVDYCQKVGQ